MLEILLFINFTGLLLASHRRMGLANPFQIYFLIWFLIAFGYYLSQNSYIKISPEFIFLILTAENVALTILILIYINHSWQVKPRNILSTVTTNDQLLLIAQILVLLMAPFAYYRALVLSGGNNIFSVYGFMQLRQAMTIAGEGFGVLAYLGPLSYALSSISMISYKNKKISLLRLLFSIAGSLFYVYLSTGRTFVLLFFILLIFPLIILKIVRIKGILFSSCLVAAMFIAVAAMTAKGINIENDFSSNFHSFLESLRSYTIAPFLALSQLIDSSPGVDLGSNTFRFFIAIFYALGFIENPPVSLIREFALVPDLTNVYTVYEAYFRDFSYVGIFFPPIFLIIHWWLYRKASEFGGIWLFYYAASVYPLVMQFFQDQYFSLLSMWIQIGFWYWLFLGVRMSPLLVMRLRNA